MTVPSTRRVSAPGLLVRTSERIAEATQPGRQPPRTSVEETVLDLAQLTWTFDDACGWLTQACGRRLTTAPGPDPAEARLDWQAPAVLASLPRAAGVTAAIDLRSLRPSRQPPREVPRLT